MAPHKLKPKPTSAVPSKKAKVTQPKSSAPSKSKSRTNYRVKRYRNGLINLEKTPPHLVDIVKSNAESPLLRLPPEIRNRIWSFACGGQLVQMRRRDALRRRTQKGGAIYYGHSADMIQSIKDSQDLADFEQRWAHPTHVTAAFHLPEVCRQIYSETALTSYRENVFLYEDNFFAKGTPMYQLMDVQAEAITTLQLDAIVLLKMVLPEGEPTPYRKHGDWGVLDVLPNVRFFIITRFAMTLVKLYFLLIGDPAGLRQVWSLEQWRDFVMQRVKIFTDAGIGLIFEK